MGKVTLLEPGLYTSIQDTGRFGYSCWGIPASGALDQFSLLMANKLLGNSADAACLEITQFGPTLQFSEDTVVLFAGAATPVLLNKGPVHLTNHQRLPIRKGDTLNIGYLTNGLRSYMAIEGGLQSETKFGSRSQSKGITKFEKLNKLDTINYNKAKLLNSPHYAKVKPVFPWMNRKIINVYPGPEFSMLNKNETDILLNSDFTISQYSNRTAIQLEEKLPNNSEQILTSPVFPGTIQLTPGGKLLILMREAQVTGGYPRIFHVKEEDLNLLAQIAPGKKIKLQLVNL
ncbi:MAG TPA: biotin-dependent carboxyltransferase family protein [Anditalea sp.]|nr:biotin-dependent carboxyltransferase family protein [Anditalea sp.]